MSTTTYFITPITARPASGPGALDGFQATCSCGLVISGSLRSYVETECIRHGSWHDKQGHVYSQEEALAADVQARGWVQAPDLTGTTVRLKRDQRRKWRVIKDEGSYLTIVSGSAFETRRKRVLRRDVVEGPNPITRSFVLSAHPDWMVREYADGHVDAAQISGPGISPGCSSIQEAIAWVKEQG